MSVPITRKTKTKLLELESPPHLPPGAFPTRDPLGLPNPPRFSEKQLLLDKIVQITAHEDQIVRQFMNKTCEIKNKLKQEYLRSNLEDVVGSIQFLRKIQRKTQITKANIHEVRESVKLLSPFLPAKTKALDPLANVRKMVNADKKEQKMKIGEIDTKMAKLTGKVRKQPPHTTNKRRQPTSTSNPNSSTSGERLPPTRNIVRRKVYESVMM